MTVFFKNAPQSRAAKKRFFKGIDWMLSEEGQYIIEETDYVGVN